MISLQDNCVLMTYSVARVVKDSLNAGGWNFEKIPAPGKKSAWLRASKAQNLVPFK